MVAALSGGSKLIFRAWRGHVANVEPGAPRSFWFLASNDLLAIWVVAVAASVTATSNHDGNPQ